MYHFDDVIDRRHTRSVKWSREVLKTSYDTPDALPLWVADMDFKTVPEVIEAMTRAVEHGVFGYSETDATYSQAIVNWYETRFNWSIEAPMLFYVPGVMTGLKMMLNTFLTKGDGVIIQEPVYFPFRSAVEANGMKVLNNPLVKTGTDYRIDCEAFESLCRLPETKLFILCNPHNPVGKVWDKETLKTLGDICVKHGVMVFADEIHHDLVLKPYVHTPFAALDERFAAITVTATAPSKTFNLAGLMASHLIISNPKIRAALLEHDVKHYVRHQSPVCIAAVEAAYLKGGPWLDALLDYLNDQVQWMDRFIKEKLPLARWQKPEATYLGWIDFSAYGEWTAVDLAKEAGVALNDGAMFGVGGAGHLRVNFACPRATLEEGFRRIRHFFEG